MVLFVPHELEYLARQIGHANTLETAALHTESQ
jgi:hypothetical protein